MYRPLKKCRNVVFFLFLSASLFSQNNFEVDCYSVMAGKNATTDNSVMLAHNEDDYGE